ncbi:MAG: peptide chain release factor 2 [Candidatus Saccharibacteria bacterium]|nr:peptide chain release factor 2 [Candidatus Saccharibacteria bacterium]
MEEIKKKLGALATELEEAWTKLNIDAKLVEKSELEKQVSEPEIWSNPENAKNLNQKLARLTEETEPWELLKTQTADLSDILELGDKDLLAEVENQLTSMEENFLNLKKELRFTGDYDSCDAILRITAGVGGTEAMDWAGMLERMYLRFFEKNNFSARLIERQQGEEAGIKTAVYEVSGSHTYGNLKSEHGVHRLVRLSPFNADNLRQTSFSLVEVLPKMDTDTDIEIDEKDLRIDVYHASGHGGQGVNTTDSAVRITHLPTGIVVAIQNERSQHANKDTAMSILKAKLVQMQQEQHAASIGELRAGESAKWGQQIRNYVLQPYKLVKDTRTKYEETDADSVLDGKISGFIDAYLEDQIGK